MTLPSDWPPILCGLIGSGIQASRTPALHEREGAEQGLRHVYKLIDLDRLDLGAEALPELLTAAEHMGFSGLHALDWRNRVATTGTIIGRRDLWGHGYGSDAAKVRTRFAFEVLGLRMLLSDVMADNAGSLRMLQKAGYKEVGRIPKRIWKRGAWRDVVVMCLENERT